MEKQTIFWLFVAIFAVTAVITLLGITGVLKNIKEKYLNTLFTALILEVIAAVFLIFQGLDFSDNRVNLATIISTSGLKAPDNTEQHENFIIQKLAEIPKIEKLESEVNQLKASMTEKDKEIETLKGDISRYDQSFYSNILKLDDQLYQIRGKTINLGFQPEKKENIYGYLVNIFRDLGIIKEGDDIYNTDKTINKLAVRTIYKDFRASYGREVEDDTKVYLQAYDISRMVGSYLKYRKITPQFQARFEATNSADRR